MEPIIGVCPLERPDAGLVTAFRDTGALGVLDLGRDPIAARHALLTLVRARGRFGVRVPEGAAITAADLPAAIEVVIVTSADDVAAFAPRTVLAQVTSLDEARAAAAAGAYGLVAKGSEAGGRIGDTTAFVLLQQIAGALDLPVWVQGGIGEHTAAGAIAGGAAGVVLDTQLALLRESSIGPEVRAAIAAMDGSETVVIAGHRVYTRPDLPVAQLAAASVDELHARLGGDDLRERLLPIGQDGALARGFARRYGSVGRAVAGLTAALERQLAQAAELAPLAPGAPLAAAHGMTYPIAQGPMSRVSDRARFAEAIANAGGLPFLALTLMTGAEVRELVRETRELVGDRPWGVGILGFVPPEIREQQLEVLREAPPPVALIAGGRPSQAAPLEALGTATYLHVPSPGLLDMFLRDGARRFVFEGRECGGHVGPRSSFALWEQQIERLLAHPDVGDVSVLFAGGIHDARSAAIVAAMAAPLAARGAKVGVLMGTAYLFTHEAVAAGAIQPGFQETAIACDRTVLLETAPGHSTRCADTDYARAFAAERRRLETAGATAQEMWIALEQLNLGRLRVAAKGLRREGDALVSVEPDAQRADGMYMIGQVAALRDATCSVAELHADVSEGSTRRLAECAAAAPGAARAAPCDVAIIGMASIFPGAPDTQAFWTNVVAGKNAIREVPPERWDVATYYDPASTGANAGQKTPCKWGGFLDEVPFDPLSYGIPPKSLGAIEPVQLLSLEVARRALADAGYAERELDRGRTSVIFGAEAGTDLSSAYGFRALYPHYVGALPPHLDARLPTLTEDSFPGVLTNVIAGRIANRLDLGGVNYTVDAACAASLAAVDIAVKELALGTSDVVLCGGADLHNGINDYLLFSSVHALSPTGQCHTFDADADGIVLGEGVACIVLKRLADAQRDGDRVYAVIKGIAGASDGKSLGLTAPRKDGQIRALERAYAQAGVSPADVGLVEAHGTGTIVGDRTELATLTEVYTRAGAPAGACVLGSVKSQIGHTKCTAGMAGLIKAALAIHHGVLPPTLNIKKPNPAWKRDASPFVFLDEARPWMTRERVAAVSAFGFGGTNFHAVLAAPEAAARVASAEQPSELFVFRGETPAAAVALIDRVRALAAGPTPPRLCDLARAACAAGAGPVQVALVADDLADLGEKLAAARALRGDRRGVHVAADVPAEVRAGAIAFVCPGQGSQRPGMLADLFVAFPQLAPLLEVGAPWAGAMLPPAAFDREERAVQAAALTDTRVAQPALGIADLAIASLLRELGVEPAMAGGHSYGELAALCLAGAMAEADLLALSRARGECILAAGSDDPGAMVAVAADAGRAVEIVADPAVVVANHNSPAQCVLSGPTPAIEKARAALTAAGVTARRLPVACAFHSPVVAPAKDTFARHLAAAPIEAPRIPVWANATAAPYPTDPDAIRALLAEQIASPVRFQQEIEAMYAAGARIFVEAGPGQVLTRLVGETLGERPHLAIACDRGESSVRHFLRALAALAVAGAPVDALALFRDRETAIVDLDAPPKPRTGFLVDGHRVRPVAAEPGLRPQASGLRPQASGLASLSPVPAPPINSPIRARGTIPPPIAPAPAPVASDRDATVLEYLRNMRALVAAQRDVMLTYLGQAPQVVIDVPVAERPLPEAPPPKPEARGLRPEASLMELTRSIVSERTGYPPETLAPDLDLEADLSIDSIKRIEIIGELASRLGLDVSGADSDRVVEELAARKTLRALVAWLEEKAPQPKSSADASPLPEPAVRGPRPEAPSRYKLAIVPAPAPAQPASVSGQRFTIIDDGGGVALGLATWLEAHGAAARVVGRGHGLTNGHASDDLIHLGALAADPADPVAAMRELFERVREAALGGARTILVATAHGGHFGLGTGAEAPLLRGGPAGLLKTVAAEFPAARTRVVDLDPRAGTGRLIEQLAAELVAADDRVEVGWPGGQRSALDIVPSPLPAPRTDAPPLLGPDSVVVITGGARGITAQVAIALARRFTCRIELVGRSAPPPVDDPAFAAATDAVALRRCLVEGGVPLDQIEARCARILADREIRATLAALAATGAPFAYHAVDVRDAAFGDLIDEIYRRHGRIDAVIHGAGVLDDKLVKHKTADSFERVFATKVAGAWTLAERLRRDVRLVMFFASISGAFGNRGQADYAAANDALDKLAWSLDARVDGRAVALDWGPWSGAGMVAPSLAREYAKRGIDLIDVELGVEAVLAEVAGGSGAQVILSCARPTALATRPAPATGAPADRPAAVSPALRPGLDG